MGHKVKLLANVGVFQGLAKQNLYFHQCVGELVDNSIAASDAQKKFRIEIIFIKNEDGANKTDLYIVDDSSGMNLSALSDALQLGKSPSSENRLNEHGFGLKNALATLSNRNGFWKIWTRDNNLAKTYSVSGPFDTEMEIFEEDFPNSDFLPSDIGTLIKVPVKLSFVQTVQGRGAPTKDLENLRQWLIEHIGVHYRGYLEQDNDSHEIAGSIIVSVESHSYRVPPIPVPIGNMTKEYIDIELGGKIYTLEYRYGTLDEVQRDKLVRGNKAKFYYQNNQKTQGIDIRLGKRVIATKQFETIWKAKNGEESLARHPNYNDFVGELKIPDLPRGVLTTVNNKTDFNLDDADWAKVFERLNEIRPPQHVRQKTEAGLRKKWVKMLKATNPDDIISDEKSVWPTGTRIDVYRKTSAGQVVIYELKVGSATALNLYQLKMYWDGLVKSGEQPKEAILLAENFSTTVEEMVNLMNELSPPDGTNKYNFKVEKLEDKQL